MKKVLIAAFSEDATVALSQVISKKYDWQIVYITIDRTGVDSCIRKFPGVIVHSIQDLRCGIAPQQYQFTKKRFVFDKSSLEFIKLYEHVFYSMADRMDENGFQFSFAQRRRHLLDVVKYWLTVLKELEIDFVISRNVPHFPGEYGMYIASQFLSRPFLMADGLANLNRSWVIFSIENRSDRLINAIEKSSNRIISNQVELLVEKLTKTYVDAAPNYFKKLRGKAKQEEKNIFSFYIRTLRTFLVHLPIAFRLSDMTLKMNHKPLQTSKSKPFMIQNMMVKLTARKRIKRNRNLYENNCSEFETNHPYVYFAPNYQPERTTYPDSDVFGDILLMLDIISSSVPDDWVIYYKEHPSIFSLPNQQIFWRGHMYRDKEFYDRVMSHSNVKLIHHETDSFSLIDGAKFTVTATGTVALESVVRGIPALIFGSTWFDQVEGLIRYSHKNDIQSLIKKIENGYTPDKNQLLEYFQSAWYFSSEKYPDLIRNNRSQSEFSHFRNRIEKMLIDFSKCFEQINHEKNTINR
ncbi:MAG: hypothetical protein GY705_28270 [Bacteroidetes bacterium]|nr:hypothetical protein [Bacteroidota bacterium]